MQRYFIEPKQWEDSYVRITGEDAHHIGTVMRGKPGDRFVVCDGSGREAVVKVRSLAKHEVLADLVSVRDSQGEPSVKITIAQALPKGDKMDIVIQKGTEVGAACFIPYSSERTIVQYDAKKEFKRLERWQKIAKEAAEQAHRGRIPEVAPVHAWQELLQAVSEVDLALFCYEKEEGLNLRQHLQRLKRLNDEAGRQVHLMLIIGPEGGFSEREAAEAVAAGCHTISLGRRILRTETAALVGVISALYEFGEIGGD